MSLKMLYAADAPIAPLSGKTVAVIGFGSQGHAHAQNLRDSGVNVIVANRLESANGRLAVEKGFSVLSVEDAIQKSDLAILTLPDEKQPEIWNGQIKQRLKPGQTVGFTHGFNVHFKTIEIPSNVDVIMVAPKGPGHLVRSEFEKGGGVPCLFAIAQDSSGKAKQTALAWANGVGGARSGIIETTFKDECETDLFGEQAVLCGGLSALIKAGFETLTEAGYPPEMAYFECVHEVKLIVDLIYAGGLDYMRYSISNTAEWGDLITGPKIVTPATKAAMKQVLTDIQTGKFAKDWRAEYEGGLKNFKRLYEADNNHPVEVTGRKLRGMMTWLNAKTPPKD
jgi:ketol-acid reductoisomerase